MARPPSANANARTTAGDGGLIGTMLLFALLAWLLRSFVVAPFSIPSGSMLPRMMIGDYLLVAKWPYGYSRFSFPFDFPPFDGRLLARLPGRGDVVVFRPPGREEADWVKRVIGLPGDRVGVRGGTLILNGRPVPKASVGNFAMPISANSPCRVVPGASPRIVAGEGARRLCLYPAYRETLPGGRSYVVLDQVDNPRADDFAPVTVPAGRLFLMGDNRDDSTDSRFSVDEGGIAFVPLDHLVGRALVGFWSTDGSAQWLKPWTWFTALRGGRIGRGFR